MPKLLLFVPCRVASLDRETDSLTLAEVMEFVHAKYAIDQVPEAVEAGDSNSHKEHGAINEFPEGTLPDSWVIATVWRRDEHEDREKILQCSQRVSLFSPQGETLFDHDFDFEMRVTNHRNVIRVSGFPLRGPGSYILRASVRTLPEGEWTTKGEFPIQVFLEQEKRQENPLVTSNSE